MDQGKILITGASGQLGSVLTSRLQQKYGIETIIASDLYFDHSFNGHFEVLDATDLDAITRLILAHDIIHIYHLAAILSAKGESFPLKTWDINMKTFFNVLEASRMLGIQKVFFPSSIAVFGNDAPKINTPQSSALNPSTVYGISKVSGEHWAHYYRTKYHLDVRSLRYPGVIGHQVLPGGGTTDYAVDIYHKAVRGENYECFLEPTTTLPMMYINDAIRATVELMEAPKEDLRSDTAYNLAAMSFSPEELTAAIRKFYPEFNTVYKPDFRQEIAQSWPSSIDDSKARIDWNWKPEFDIDSMTETMIKHLKQKHSPELQNY